MEAMWFIANQRIGRYSVKSGDSFKIFDFNGLQDKYFNAQQQVGGHGV